MKLLDADRVRVTGSFGARDCTAAAIRFATDGVRYLRLDSHDPVRSGMPKIVVAVGIRPGRKTNAGQPSAGHRHVRRANCVERAFRHRRCRKCKLHSPCPRKSVKLGDDRTYAKPFVVSGNSTPATNFRSPGAQHHFRGMSVGRRIDRIAYRLGNGAGLQELRAVVLPTLVRDDLLLHLGVDASRMQ